MRPRSSKKKSSSAIGIARRSIASSAADTSRTPSVSSAQPAALAYASVEYTSSSSSAAAAAAAALAVVVVALATEGSAASAATLLPCVSSRDMSYRLGLGLEVRG
jgi:hypothetical protein